MKKLLLVFFVLIAAFLPIFSAFAQDEPECEPDFAPILEMVSQAEAALTDGDLTTFLETLREIRIQMALIDSACSGLGFEGETGQEVLGPVVIPEGIYRVTINAEDGLKLDVTAIEGKCGKGSGGYYSSSIFTEYEPVENAEILFTSEGCEALWEIRADAPYTVAFEKIK